MALSDLNGDGNLDLVSIINLGGSSALTLALGNGDGTFQPSSSSVFNSAGLQPTSVAIHDLNGDGFLDVVAIYKFTGVVAIYDGNGDGTFQSADVLTIEPSPSSIGFGDIFRDGSPEIFITHETTNSLTILSYNGVDYDVNTTVNTGTAPSGVVVGDFTGYGSRGIATSDKGSNTVSVIYAGDGFSPPDIYQVGDSPSSITAADLNGDGVEDLITANKGSNNVSILIGGFYGTFQPQVTYATGLAPVSVQVTDVNGDGNYDLVVATSDGNAVSVLRGNGDGTFQPSQDVPTGIGPAVVTVGDINGDGRPDLLTADQLGTGVTLLLNATRGDFVGQVYNRLSNGPAFTSPNSVDVPENTPATTNILQVAASNPDDASQTFTYGMTGTDAEQFTIDPATGIIRFNTTPDYELPLDQDQDNVYHVQISANDGLGTTITQNLTITVLPLNDNQPVFSSSNFAFVSENTPAQDVILTAFATDADIPSQTIAYSLSGTDAAKFSIDPNTGAIRFLASPDFEVPGDQDGDNIYDIIVTANDGNGGQQSQIVTISVFPLNDNYPVITSPNSVEVDENTPETDVILTAHATDADLPAQSLGYDLSGTDAELFTIDSQTGEIRFLVSPDYENPLDQNGDNVYEVVLSVGDFQEGTEVQTQTILIKVLPLNDNAPLYESPSYVSVDENTPATTVVQSISAYDIDQPAQTLTYSLSGDDAAWFSISNTGEIRFLNSPNVEAPLDLDGNNVYEITISVTDSGSPSLTTTRTLSIEVLDVGESPIADDGTLDVTENTQTTGQLSGSDQDAESTLTFIILTQPEHGSVELTNPATGAYIYTPDTDYSGPDSFTFQVSDGSLDSNIATVAITVNALNSPPVISETTLSVPENSPNGTVVGTVIAVDPDVVSGPGSDVLTFSITAGNTNDAFSIDPSNGEIRVSNSAALDFETLQQFTLRIRVTDLGGHTVFGSITVNVTNVNEPLIITLPTETPIYRKNGPPAPIDTEATVYDADFTPIEFRGGLLQVTVTNSGASDPNDRISIMVQGTGAGKISLVSNYIVYDSPLNIIGT
ncbi:MAG: cadherin domain-containing protein, partial [Planctomycetota bacterium]